MRKDGLSLRNYGLSLLAIFFVIIAIIFGSEIYRNRWEIYTSYEGRYIVYHPAKDPIGMTYQVKTDAGEIDVHTVVTVQGGVGYEVSYCDFPKKFIQANILDKVFAISCFRKSDIVKGNFISKRSIMLNGYPGLEVRFYSPNEIISKARMYLVKNRLYQLTVSTFEDREDKILNGIGRIF
ncbi:MAG: hypothetical protein HC935_00565 [Pseudanabaena sp. SU_2_4]|nr:hypothetical protein [Pseudanabaena sp. SU_2_4]